MGVSCKIFRKKDGSVEKVVAPNGQPSSLYSQALDLLGDEEQALEVWATAYTPQFVSYYGYWSNPKPDEVFSLDENGEPEIDDIIKYLEKDTCVIDSFTRDDLNDINSFVASVGFSDAESLSDAVRASFYKNGELVVNRATLSNSGLYDTAEVNRIMSDPEIMNSVSESLKRFVDNFNTTRDDGRRGYYMSNEDNPEYLVNKTDSFNQFGKRDTYNPSEIDIILREKTGGIKDRVEFDSAINDTGIPELIDMYENNLDFKEYVYDTYSNMDEVETVIVGPDGVKSDTPSYMKLRNYSYNNMAEYNNIRSAISDVLSLSEEESDSKRAVDGLRRIELLASKFGIDIKGLSDVESINEDVESLLEDLDIYITRLRKGDTDYGSVLGESIDKVLGNRKGRVLSLPSYLKDKPVVFIDTDVSDKEMLDKFGLLRVEDNIYYRMSPGSDISDSEYESFVDLVIDNPSILPASAYPAPVFKNGYVDKSKLRKADRKRVSDGVRNYILSLTDSNNNERMILSRILIGSPVVITRSVNTQREFDKYVESKGKDINPESVFRLWKSYLSAKVSGSPLYSKVFRFLDFRGGAKLGLKSLDQSALRSIDNNSFGSVRKALFDYAMATNDSSMDDLFYLENNPIKYAGEDFYYYLYKRNPELLKEYKGEVKTYEDGDISIPGMYDGFMKIGNKVYMKVGEDYKGSVYRFSDKSASETKHNFTQTKKSFDFSNIGESESLVKEERKLYSQSESSELECQ